MSKVYCPDNGQFITEITIRARDIKDLIEAPKVNAESAPVPTTAPLVIKKSFEDPAILSMGRRPAAATSIPISQPIPGPRTVSIDEIRPPSGAISKASEGHVINAISDEVEEPAIKIEDERSDIEAPQIQIKKSRSRKRRGKGIKQTGVVDLAGTGEEATESGWRQTPLLEPNPSFQPFATLKKKPKGKTYDNGWATEDATDVQDMGDFDFESNLSKFDKRTVFEGIRAEDMTAEEDRLVGHNRLARPGTYGGKNLHPSENVLDGMHSKAAWNSEADDSERRVDAARGSQRDTGSGRTSRRGDSKLRKAPLRKESGAHEPFETQPVPSLQSTVRGTFATLSGNKRCDVVSHLHMLNLENIADSEYGLSEEQMAENSGRSLAELIIALTFEREQTWGREATNRVPYVAVLAGNNKSGLRAVAAGRHLRNHGLNVVVCVLGLEREAELLVGLRRQLKVFRAFGGKTFSKIQLMEYAKSVERPPGLIIDGLLGLTIAFEELRTGDQAEAFELIEWANRSEAEVMAIDIPSGIDPGSGRISIIDGRPLYIRPAHVVSLAAPKKGLLQAMSLGEGVGSPDEWRLWVADIGIAPLAWKKAGTRMRRAVEFGRTWTVEISFQTNPEQ